MHGGTAGSLHLPAVPDLSPNRHGKEEVIIVCTAG